MEAFFVSTLVVALAELSDRTQLLAIMLAGRLRKPLPILLGIFAGSIANHTLAAAAGVYLSSLLSAHWFRYVISASFIAVAIGALLPGRGRKKKSPTHGERRMRSG